MLVCGPPSPSMFLRQPLAIWGLFRSLKEKQPTVCSLGKSQRPSSHYTGKGGFSFCLFCFVLPLPAACRSFQARDQTRASAVTTLDP